MSSSIRSYGNNVATEPFKQQSIEREVVGGMVKPIKTTGVLTALKVIYGNDRIKAGQIVYVPSDQWVTLWAKRVLDVNSQKVIMVPENEILLIEDAQ